MSGSRECYSCQRKAECYSKEGLAILKPGVTYKEMTGYECGTPYTTLEEAIAFVKVLSEAIDAQGNKVRDKIIEFVAERYDLPTYNISIELE